MNSNTSANQINDVDAVVSECECVPAGVLLVGRSDAVVHLLRHAHLTHKTSHTQRLLLDLHQHLALLNAALTW